MSTTISEDINASYEATKNSIISNISGRTFGTKFSEFCESLEEEYYKGKGIFHYVRLIYGSLKATEADYRELKKEYEEQSNEKEQLKAFHEEEHSRWMNTIRELEETVQAQINESNELKNYIVELHEEIEKNISDHAEEMDKQFERTVQRLNSRK